MISVTQVFVFAQDTHPEMTLVDSVVVTEQKEGKIATYNLTATKLPVPNRLTPASVSVVTQAVFNAQNSTVLGDALRNISGINVQSGNGVYDYFTIRGFNSLDNGLVLTNGTAEPEVT
ncbi:MAG: Plug domain-containing protein, partial [Calditrichaeota bacterium]|nr:Plug domain-containing protein [Calditrichota bacterium]